MNAIIGRASLGLLCATIIACNVHGNDGTKEPTRRAGQALTDGHLPAGTTLSIDVSAPVNGTVVTGGTVDVTGTASIGSGLPLPNTTLVYVLDVSGSTTGAGCGGDQNGDGAANTILDCEIAATRALNQQAIADGTIGEVGVVAFGTTGAAGDVGPAGGGQLVTGPSTDANGNGTPDVEEVLSSARVGLLQRFTVVSPGSATSYGAALGAVQTVLGAATKPNKVVVFLSDGLNNTPPSVPSVLTTFPADATVHTFAIGPAASCTGASASLGNLQELADARGGTCTNVPNIAALPDVLPDVVASRLVRVSLTVDGAPVADPAVSPALPQNGPKSVTWSTSLTGLTAGLHTLCATAQGTDAGGSGAVTDCVQIRVNAPPTARCKDVAASADATCSATASIDDGSFDPDGDAFTCTQVPTTTGIGTTTAMLTCTDANGASSSCTATITVTDTTPPVVTTTGDVPSLWPPNHGYRAFALGDCITSIVDNCGGALDVATAAHIVRVESDEGESATGTGSTCEDAVITSPTTADLRAERAGNGDGRVYTVHFEAVDGAGRATPGTCRVQVAKSASPADAVATDSGCHYCVGAGCGACPGPAPTCH